MIHWPIILYNYSYIDIVCINYNVYNNSYTYRLITCMNTYQSEISRSTREPLWVHHGNATQLTAEYWLEILTVGGIDRVAYWKWIPNTFERLVVDGLASFLIRLWDPDGPHVWSRFVTFCNHETHENRYVWHSLYKRQSWSPGGIANNNGRHAGMDRNWATCSSGITPWTKGMHWGYDAETAVSGKMDYSLKPRIAWDVFGTWTFNHPMSSKCSPGFTNIKQISVNMIP